ncbi:MAG TPA: DUF3806 domain-containing protein [Microbacterium sp.]|uniref:DUF3806 domain-containing protein n=1 Tax=Microbacterium sp. TaxID=51671 RepID=UPI002C18F07E|nr:DUF3806 domain-containing protein [Microbacterium sp.]HWI30773.1 DUF3806 domain-containing protein [Microbacterium sp.]
MKEITELTEDESDWVESLVTTLGTLGVAAEPAALDAFLDQSRETWTLESSDPTPVINLVGAGIGHYLATTLALRWVRVTDKRGQRLAVYGDSKKTLAFPLAAVARRWGGEPGSLTRYVEETIATITQLRAGIAS